MKHGKYTKEASRHMAARLAKNAESKDAAINDGQPWDQHEIALLMTWDRTEDELDVMAEVLGRTREACRQRFYEVLAGRQPASVKTTTTTSTETVVHYGNWDPDDTSPWYV